MRYQRAAGSGPIRGPPRVALTAGAVRTARDNPEICAIMPSPGMECLPSLGLTPCGEMRLPSGT